MSYENSAPEIQLQDMSGFEHLHGQAAASQAAPAYQSPDRSHLTSSLAGDDDDRSRPHSPLSIHERPLLQPDDQTEGNSATVERRRWVVLLKCLPHMIPLGIAITILILNALEVYWQDLGRPNQSTILQALQYAAKAHEVTMAASLTAIVVHQIQYDLSGSNGVPLGFMTAGFQLSDPLFLCTKKYFGAVWAPAHSKGPWRSSALTYLVLLGFLLTLIVGPSSAVAMIPRLDWWVVSQMDAFGPEYTDRVYFNRTEDELWPANISQAIFADPPECSSINSAYEDCAVAAADVVGPWISLHQSQGTKPNLTVFQDSEVTRYLTSQGGPPDNSSWTVSSTIGSIFAKDLDHYWDWLLENSSLPANIDRPLIQPSFKNSTFKMRKPLVQTQCRTYYNPDWEHENFEFPHDELLTPPLDVFKNDTWKLPNEFVMNLKGNDSQIGDMNDTTHPWMLFRWFDAASQFSSAGAPSLGAVVLYLAYNGTDLVNATTTCSFDSRWAPVEYYLDPKDTITIYQSSPNPMDILNGSSKEATSDLTQMRISLDWAHTLNTQGDSDNVRSTTVIEQMLERFSGGNFIFPEPAQILSAGYNMKSVDWRLSTTFGLYLTEGLARAFSDVSKGSMLYRQAPTASQSYIRYLNDINQPALKEGYKDGKLDWVEMRDPRWNSSILPWDEWAPQNGYTEITFTIRRNGYGYGFDGIPIKLATLVLACYVLLVSAHIISVLFGGHIYKGCSNVSEMLILAWSSAPVNEVQDFSAAGEKLHTWGQVVRAREEEQRLQLVIDTTDGTAIR